ncbi:hypothetical protein KC909_00915 [Candidatus Dojkabacteria bacterium]|uniref:Protein kinase domain-containing protein n=1 Tax=Candidatus Dojkabacteria bacterium TaxID=2099670 RepID=A0A955RIM1_9BACT|nr:hypothetical protein [Candidatus Dojkabacteria bacterium]
MSEYSPVITSKRHFLEQWTATWYEEGFDGTFYQADYSAIPNHPFDSIYGIDLAYAGHSEGNFATPLFIKATSAEGSANIHSVYELLDQVTIPLRYPRLVGETTVDVSRIKGNPDMNIYMMYEYVEGLTPLSRLPLIAQDDVQYMLNTVYDIVDNLLYLGIAQLDDPILENYGIDSDGNIWLFDFDTIGELPDISDREESIIYAYHTIAILRGAVRNISPHSAYQLIHSFLYERIPDKADEIWAQIQNIDNEEYLETLDRLGFLYAG